MYFNVSQLMKEASGARRDYQVEEAGPLKDDSPCVVSGQVKFLRTDQGIWVSARLTSNVPNTCSRCLKEYEQPIDMAIEEEFLPVVDVATGARRNDSDESNEHFYIDHNHILDLAEAASQYASMAMPMKPMCRKDCPGICFTCGADLGNTTCDCDESQVDPRWNSLLEAVSADGDGL